jgi:hypothetical protein
VAISNHRLCTPENGRVSFEWKDYAHQGQNKIMTLDAIEFMRRFLLHVLPSGLARIRQFGFLGNRFRTRNLRLCRDLLAVGQTLAPSDSHNPADTDGPDHSACPICKLGQLILIEVSTPNGPWFRTLHDTIARPFLVEFPHLASGFGRSPCTSQLSASKFVLTHLRPFLSLPPSLHTTPPVPFQAFWASCLSSCVLPAKMKDPDFTRHERNDGRLNGSRRETIRFVFRTVDKIEDAKTQNINKAQQSSTSCPHLIETEAIENRALSQEVRNCLGRRCATRKRILRFNNLEGRG